MGKSSRISVGIDLGGTKMYAVVLDQDSEVIGTARRPTNGHEGPDTGVENLLKTAQEAIESADCKDAKIEALGIGCPGVVDLNKGVLKVAPNLGWEDVPIGKALSKAFDCPVTVLNDVDAGTYGEYRFGAGKKAMSLLGVFPGTGLGGGFIYDGAILHGKRYSCMEISDLRVGGASLLRHDGEWATLEDLTSRLAISSAITIEAYRGHAPSLVGTPIGGIKSKMIANAIENGEKAVEEILEEAIRVLGIGLSGLIATLAPEVLVLGGGLVEKFPDRYVKGLGKEFKKTVPPMLLDDLKIVPAELGDDAGAKGAAAYAVKQANQ